MFFLVSLGCAHTMQNEKQPLPVVLYYGKPERRAIISHEAAQIRCAEGSAKFDKHEKIHKNRQKYFVVTQGRCAQCGIEDKACESIRVSILRSLAAPRYSAPLSGKHMRVKPSRTRRNTNLDNGLIRAIDPDQAQIACEIRQMNEPGLGMWNPERNHLHNDLRVLDLEVSHAKIYGGIEAAKAKRAEQKQLFIDWVTRLEGERGRGQIVADEVVNYSKFLFSSHDSVLDPFKSLLRELSGIAKCNQRLRNDIVRRRLLKTMPVDSKLLTAELRLSAKRAGLTLEEAEAKFSHSLGWLKLVEKAENPESMTPERKTQIIQFIIGLHDLGNTRAIERELKKVKTDQIS